MRYKSAIKAGKLANGEERGKGSVVHLVSEDSLYYGTAAMCGERPAITWSERENLSVTCKKCLKIINKKGEAS